MGKKQEKYKNIVTTIRDPLQWILGIVKYMINFFILYCMFLLYAYYL